MVISWSQQLLIPSFFMMANCQLLFSFWSTTVLHWKSSIFWIVAICQPSQSDDRATLHRLNEGTQQESVQHDLQFTPEVFDDNFRSALSDAPPSLRWTGVTFCQKWSRQECKRGGLEEGRWVGLSAPFCGAITRLGDTRLKWWRRFLQKKIQSPFQIH